MERADGQHVHSVTDSALGYTAYDTGVNTEQDSLYKIIVT